VHDKDEPEEDEVADVAVPEVELTVEEEEEEVLEVEALATVNPI